MKGYASDSTVGHSGNQDQPKPLSRKKRRLKMREQESHHLKEYRVNPVLGVRAAAANPGMVRRKSTSTGSIYKAPPEFTLSSSLGESKDNLLPDTRPKRKTSTHRDRKPPKPDFRHSLHPRRGSIDNGPSPHHYHHQRRGSVDALASSARAGSISPNKPPIYAKKFRHTGKEKERPFFRSRQMSQSLKFEHEWTPSSGKAEGGDGGGGTKNMNRSHSFSSVDDYDHGLPPVSPEGAVFEEGCLFKSPTLSGSKWIIYGFL